MASLSRSIITLALWAASASLTTAQSGTGITTRYWDCCKPSCAWPGKGANPVATCDKNDNPITDVLAKSGCEGGTAFMCSSAQPWAVNDNLAYGFAAVSAAKPTCCQCYKLTFTSGPIAGKVMVVQATNTGGDVQAAQFDLAIPGGGFGIYDACSSQYQAKSSVWGAQYGGSKTNTCAQFPSKLQAGCGFRWGWMKGADNPDVKYEVVTCPAELNAKSGCSGSTTAVTNSPPVIAAPDASSSSIAAVAAPSSPAVGTSTNPGTTIPIVVQPDDDECENDEL